MSWKQGFSPKLTGRRVVGVGIVDDDLVEDDDLSFTEERTVVTDSS